MNSEPTAYGFDTNSFKALMNYLNCSKSRSKIAKFCSTCLPSSITFHIVLHWKLHSLIWMSMSCNLIHTNFSISLNGSMKVNQDTFQTTTLPQKDKIYFSFLSGISFTKIDNSWVTRGREGHFPLALPYTLKLIAFSC